MELPIQAYGSTVTVGKLYFFKTGCPIGVENHIHVCIFRDNRIFVFATGSSQLDKAKKRAAFLHYSPKSYPILSKDEVNKFDKDTYIDCNKPIETSSEAFSELLNQHLIMRWRVLLTLME